MLRPPMPTKAERSDATRQALVRVARRLFAKHGFAETSTEAIVQAAGVTQLEASVYRISDGPR